MINELGEFQKRFFALFNELSKASNYMSDENYSKMMGLHIFENYQLEYKILELKLNAEKRLQEQEETEREMRRTPMRFRLPWYKRIFHKQKTEQNNAQDLFDVKMQIDENHHFQEEFAKLICQFPNEVPRELLQRWVWFDGDSEAESDGADAPDGSANDAPREFSTHVGNSNDNSDIDAEAAAAETVSEEPAAETPLEKLAAEAAQPLSEGPSDSIEGEPSNGAEQPKGEPAWPATISIRIDEDDNIRFKILKLMFPQGACTRRIKYSDIADELGDGTTAETVRYNVRKLLEGGYIVSHGQEGYAPTDKVIFSN